MNPEPEINALSNVYEALKGLNKAQIKRILDWVTAKFILDTPQEFIAQQREAAPSTQPEILPESVEPPQPVVEPVKKRRGRKPGKKKRMVEETQETPLQPVEPKITGFIEYDNFEDLLLFSNSKTNTAKILLAAAFLQDKKNLKEFGSYDISSMFKKIGEEVKHPSAAINSLMSKKPPLLVQTGTQGTSKQSRRKFRVTEEGLKMARNYIK
ncbi:MAG: hypothetical protein JSV88_19200 [Candidatus Aminicenantes bacterium]|nr:MAG: hypothetical protein JSV88_19200 [Candidatus Aminicenantes bacterium]